MRTQNTYSLEKQEMIKISPLENLNPFSFYKRSWASVILRKTSTKTVNHKTHIMI